MKLVEIFDTIPKGDGPETDIYHILKRLAQKKGKKIFTGQFAYAVESNDGKSMYRLWNWDNGYEAWLPVALKMQDNPHIVKILSKVRTLDDVRFHGHNGQTLKFVKIEKLTHIGDMHDAVAEAITLMDAVRFVASLETVRKMNVDEFIELALDPKTAETNFIDQISPNGEEYLRNHRKFAETYLELAKLGYNDMNIDNIMLRGDVPVIVDPCADM